MNLCSELCIFLLPKTVNIRKKKFEVEITFLRDETGRDETKAVSCLARHMTTETARQKFIILDQSRSAWGMERSPY